MKKLIKISDYYYVINDKDRIKEGDVVYNKHNNSTPNHIHIQKGVHNDISDMKVIATTSISLPLPQITNASYELIDKEVEVESVYDFKCDCGFNTDNIGDITIVNNKAACPKCGEYFITDKFAILKPITKETFVEGLPIFDTYLKSIKEPSTETLEEVAHNYMNKTYSVKGDVNPQNYIPILGDYVEEIQTAFIAGYKHCEKTMYSLETISNALKAEGISFSSELLLKMINNDKK